MRLTFLDFETATGDRASACSLGLVILEGREVVARKTWLIRPPDNKYDGFNIYIHGITPSMTENALEFAGVWEQARPYLQGGVAVAHNASFDISVLRKSLERLGLSFPALQYYCTLVLSRVVLPGRPTYRLDSLCEHFGIEFQHHDAEADAWAASQLLVKYLELSGAQDIAALAENHGVGVGILRADGYRPCRGPRLKKMGKSKSDPPGPTRPTRQRSK
jgi:DNA polymerase III subunit epsilon